MFFGKKEGIFVDVDGTLILYDVDKCKEILNQKLVNKLLLQKKQIIVFSGGYPPKQTDRLKLLGCPKQLLPVKDKEDFYQYHLEIVVDDDYCVSDSNVNTQYFSPEEFLLH